METKGTITKETDLLTMEQAADYLGYKKGYLYKLVHFKKIPHLKYGARFVRFRLADLEQWKQAKFVEVPSMAQMQANAARYCLEHPKA